MQKLIIVLTFLVSLPVLAVTVPVAFEIQGDTMIAVLTQDKEDGKNNIVQNFFRNLAVAETDASAGETNKKFLSRDQNLAISCSEIKKNARYFFTCTFSMSLTDSGNYRIVPSSYGGGTVIAKDDMARELIHILGANPNGCWSYEYAENFYIQSCPDSVAINIYPVISAQ